MVIINTREVHIIYGYPGASYVCLRFDTDFLYTTDGSRFEYRYLRPLTEFEFNPQQHFNSSELRGSGIDAQDWSI